MICTPIVTSLHTTCVCWLLNCCVVWWIKCSCRQKRYLLRLHKFLASGNMFLSIGCKWYTHIILTRGNTSPSDRFSWYRQDSLCIGLCALPRSCYQCQSHPDPNSDQIVRLLLKVLTVDEIIYIKTCLFKQLYKYRWTIIFVTHFLLALIEPQQCFMYKGKSASINQYFTLT